MTIRSGHKNGTPKFWAKLEPLLDGLRKLGSITAAGVDIGKKALTAYAVAAVAAGTAVAGIAIKLGKSVVTAYADYEQLVGGVETLFGAGGKSLEEYAESVGKTTDEAADEYAKLIAAQEDVASNAANAYKTAGLSANEYMETVTSFSASLIASLDGDTERAAAYADMAITDMADNANKMGTSIEDIQNAYQGFAKQNYTMLDNLKLGYGGTKSEMERLLADATAISGIEYDISSYADIVEAIHVVQDEMGIAGATADEAEHTISGSMNALKATLGNLMVGFGDSNADIQSLAGNVVSAFETVVQNVVPVVENIVTALPAALGGISDAVGSLLPSLISTFSELFSNALGMLGSLMPTIIPTVVDSVLMIIDALMANLPTFLSAFNSVILKLVSSVSKGLPTIIETVLPALVDGLVELVQGLVAELPTVLPLLLQAGITLFLELLNGMNETIPMLVEMIPALVQQLADVLIANLPLIIQGGVQLIIGLAGGLIQAIPDLIGRMPEIIEGIASGLLEGIARIGEIGLNLVQGLWQGILDAKDWLLNKVKEWCGSILNGIKSFFGINSPSTVMRDGVGHWMAEGIGVGFVNQMSKVRRDMQRAIPSNFDTAIRARYTGDTPPEGAGGPAGGTGGAVYNQTNNYYSPKALSAAEAARKTRNDTRQLILQGAPA